MQPRIPITVLIPIMTWTAKADSATTPPPSTSSPMIEVVNLSKVYGRHVAVNDVTFSVGRGEILGFLGPNGAGKSTTMRVLTGYTPATSGHARIAGHDVLTDSYEARASLGYLPENAPLYLSMNARAFLRFMAGAKGIPASKRESAIDRAIEECALQQAAGRIIADLSKGFRQRVGLAQAILGDPPVLILDEPTVGLDPQQIAGIRKLIMKMAGSRTVLLSTHILPEVSMVCQRVVVIHRGRLVASGTPDRLEGASITPSASLRLGIRGDAGKVAVLLGGIEGIEGVERENSAVEGVALFRITPKASADPRAEIARSLIENGIGLLELSRSGVSLEDVFLRVISASEHEGGEA